MSKAAKRERQRLNREARREIEEREDKRRRRLKALRNGLIVVVPIALVFTIFQVVRNDDGDSDETEAPPPAYVTLTTNLGDIVIELDPEEAPETAANFEDLVSQGFYNNLTIHRASTAVGVIQGGDPNGDGSGGPGYSIDDELPTKGPYQIGDVAMANSGPDTAGSQFFIVTGTPGTQLPLDYTRFGRVISGLDVAQLIEGLAPPEGDGPPTQAVTIISALVTSENPVAPTTTVPADPTATTAAPPPAS